MLEWVSLVIVPLAIAIVAKLGSFKKDNEAQHAETAHSLNVIMTMIGQTNTKVDGVATKLDEHIGEHRAKARRKALADA